MSSDDDALPPPSAARVLARASCLSAVVCRSFIDPSAGEEQFEALNARITPWLAQSGAASELEPWEARALALPLGSLDTRTRIDGTWASEGLAVLAWALTRHDLPPHDVSVDPQSLTDALGFLQTPDPATATPPMLRPAADIEAAGERAFILHWRLRDFSLAPRHMDFADFAATAWFGPFDIAGIPLADGDLAIGGTPIAHADPDRLRQAFSIAQERHKAFNWLRGYHDLYSEVDTST